MNSKRTAAALFTLLLSATCFGSDSDVQAQIRDLRQGQKAILMELETIRDILAGKQPPLDNVPVHVGGAPSAGSPNATIAIVEFADFQCPYCARHFKEVYPMLFTDYIKPGKVRYFFLDFPLESIHPAAPKAAEAARCAASQGKFPEMYEQLFGNQNSLSPEALAGHAGAIGLDLERFQACLSSGTYIGDVRRDVEEGQRIGVEVTPTFFLGTVDSTVGIVSATVMLKGAQPYAAFRDALDKLASSR